MLSVEVALSVMASELSVLPLSADKRQTKRTQPVQVSAMRIKKIKIKTFRNKRVRNSPKEPYSYGEMETWPARRDTQTQSDLRSAALMCGEGGSSFVVQVHEEREPLTSALCDCTSV